MKMSKVEKWSLNNRERAWGEKLGKSLDLTGILFQFSIQSDFLFFFIFPFWPEKNIHHNFPEPKSVLITSFVQPTVQN